MFVFTLQIQKQQDGRIKVEGFISLVGRDKNKIDLHKQ